MKGKSRTLKYYTGETVWTLNGTDWFMTDLNDVTKPIKTPKTNNVAIDMTNI